VAAVAKKIRGIQAGTDGAAVANTSSEDGGVLGWFMEAGSADDFQKANVAFKKAVSIVDRLAAIENV
jgi:hypothetical protein